MNKIFTFLFICCSSAAYGAQPSEIPVGWQERGKATTVLFGFPLYRGTLYTPSSKAFHKNSKYALSLEYLRALKAATLVKSTVKEIKRTEGLSAEVSKGLTLKLMKCFVNVKAGDRITAIAQNAERTLVKSFNLKGKQIVVMDVSENKENPIVLINPEIIDKSEDTLINEEGCLSVPGCYAKVDRHTKVTVKALDKNGKEFTLDGEELLAICIQHELDHLKGILFVDYLSSLKRNMLIKRVKKLVRIGDI